MPPSALPLIVIIASAKLIKNAESADQQNHQDNRRNHQSAPEGTGIAPADKISSAEGMDDQENKSDNRDGVQ